MVKNFVLTNYITSQIQQQYDREFHTNGERCYVSVAEYDRRRFMLTKKQALSLGDCRLLRMS